MIYPILISYNTDCYQTGCSYCDVRYIFAAPFKYDFKICFFIHFISENLKILRLRIFLDVFNVMFAISIFKQITIEAIIFWDIWRTKRRNFWETFETFGEKKQRNVFQIRKKAKRKHWIGSCNKGTRLLKTTESKC